VVDWLQLARSTHAGGLTSSTLQRRVPRGRYLGRRFCIVVRTVNFGGCKSPDIRARAARAFFFVRSRVLLTLIPTGRVFFSVSPGRASAYFYINKRHVGAIFFLITLTPKTKSASTKHANNLRPLLDYTLLDLYTGCTTQLTMATGTLTQLFPPVPHFTEKNLDDLTGKVWNTVHL
jgi:hypothetical protein